MADLWFIRHFRTPWNRMGRLQGQQDIALDDPLGPEDLAALDRNLRALRGREFALVLSSPLQRAMRTAALHGFPDAEPDPDLAEMTFGPWEGRSWAELEAAHPDAWRDPPRSLPLGETAGDFADRVARVRDRALRAPGATLIFGHGAWLNGLLQIVPGSDGRYARQTLGNGTLLRLTL